MSGDALALGLSFLRSQQDSRGALMADYDGPLFLTPGYVFARYCIGRPLRGDDASTLLKTFHNVQNADGSFGLHFDGAGYVFTTALSYVAMRLLGESADSKAGQAARAWLLDHGGAVMSPGWGKYWLATLGLYDWSGVHPVTPELWLLPRSLPIHPTRWWCHARAVYLPVSYLYATRYQAPRSDVLDAVHQEIYTSKSVDWVAARNYCSPTDRFVEASPALAVLNRAVAAADRHVPPSLRGRAIDAVLDQIMMGEENTDYLDIGPVSKAFNVVALHRGRPNTALAERAAHGMERYIRDQARGRSMLAYSGSETWDTLYAALAVAESGCAEQHLELVNSCYEFIDSQQLMDEPMHLERAARDERKGAWGFAQNGWPVVDCTALGILSALKLRALVQRPIEESRLMQAVERLLAMQNKDGGFGTYEKARAGAWLEWINPSEVFSDIMLEHSQTELTSSAISALAFAVRHLILPPALEKAALGAVKRAGDKLLELQRDDGSFEGNWGICFTYGTYFGVTGLSVAAPRHAEERIHLAAQYLLNAQNPDGGFGESYKSCLERFYVPHENGSQAPMTAWGALALQLAPSVQAQAGARRAERWLQEHQLPNGDWPATALTGVFNKTCMLNYPLYRNYFPLLALGAAARAGSRITSNTTNTSNAAATR